MEAIVPSSQEHQAMTEDSSDRSDESSTMSQDYHSRGFDDYDIVKRVNESVDERSSGRNNSRNVARDFRLSVGRNADSEEQPRNNSAQFDGVLGHECSLYLGKSKKYDFAGVHLDGGLNYQTERVHGPELANEGSQVCRSKDSTMKEAFLNLQSARDQYLATNLERLPKELNYLVEREIKEYGIAKGYNLTLDRMKEFKLPHDRARENQPNALPATEGLNDVGITDANDHRDPHGQTRTPQDLECIVYEHTRRPHHHFLNRIDLSRQHLTSSPHVRQASVTQLQQSQQQQQQQIKSFTIDAILAHRNNQNRERYQRNQQQQLRKATRAVRQECQEVTEKKSGLCTGRVPDTSVNDVSAVVNSGKAKRVRTIFTAEQLERLEGEFARQQYMVGPERLYLAHALRLTEAQVKVWFQNRRIKWRKINHEQQCQAVSEHRQRCSLPGTLEIHEDESSDTSNVNWCINSTIASNNPGDEASLINASNQQQRDIRDSSILKS